MNRDEADAEPGECKCGSLCCFYCDLPLAPRHEHDHFPVPRVRGGEVTVPTCQSCHTLKDRMALKNWPASEVFAVWPTLTPMARIFLAKCIATMYEAGVLES